MKVLMVVAVALLLFAGCGDDDETEAVAPSTTELTVTVYPEGPGKPGETTTTVTDAGGVTAQDFEPVPPDQACTQIFGGPQTATVTGTLDGQPIDAEFQRTNGCEIERWDTAEPVLGEPPAAP